MPILIMKNLYARHRIISSYDFQSFTNHWKIEEKLTCKPLSESHLFCNFALSHVPHGGRTLKCEGVSIGNASHLKNHKTLILSLSKIRYIVQVGPQHTKAIRERILKINDFRDSLRLGQSAESGRMRCFALDCSLDLIFCRKCPTDWMQGFDSGVVVHGFLILSKNLC